MDTTLSPVTVAIYGGQPPDGDEISMAMVTSLGESPHATVKLFQYDFSRKQLVEFDCLTECTVDETGNRIVVEGTSQWATEVNELPVSEANVRWVIDIKGCQSCN